MAKAVDLTNFRFSRLLVLKFAEIRGRFRCWECLCDCGNITIVSGVHLTHGHTKSCGCLLREVTTERMLKHGANRCHQRTPEYRAWSHMIERCTNPKSKGFINYGGRGITICDKWRNNFEAFFSNMGPRPYPEYTIERINNNGNYEPGNCKWATRQEQSENRRNVKKIELQGINRTISEWSRIFGINDETVRRRIKKGWIPKQAIITPVWGHNENRI